MAAKNALVYWRLRVRPSPVTSKAYLSAASWYRTRKIASSCGN